MHIKTIWPTARAEDGWRNLSARLANCSEQFHGLLFSLLNIYRMPFTPMTGSNQCEWQPLGRQICRFNKRSASKLIGHAKPLPLPSNRTMGAHGRTQDTIHLFPSKDTHAHAHEKKSKQTNPTQKSKGIETRRNKRRRVYQKYEDDTIQKSNSSDWQNLRLIYDYRDWTTPCSNRMDWV